MFPSREEALDSYNHRNQFYLKANENEYVLGNEKKELIYEGILCEKHILSHNSDFDSDLSSYRV